jgi:hypothetical protein
MHTCNFGMQGNQWKWIGTVYESVREDFLQKHVLIFGGTEVTGIDDPTWARFSRYSLSLLPFISWQRINHALGSTPGLDFYLLCEPICVSLSLFHMYIVQATSIWPYTLMRKGSVGHSCRAIGSKMHWLWCGSPGDFSQGIDRHYGRPWSLNLLFLLKGIWLVLVSVVVSLMLAVLPYARGRGFDSRSYMPNTRRFRSSPSSPDTAVEMSPIPMRGTASTGGSKPRLYCHRSTQYILHCVGDAIHARRYEYNSSIVLVLDTLSRPVTWG